MNFHDRCSRGMRVQIELQQLQEDFGVEHGKREIQGADKFCLAAARSLCFALLEIPTSPKIGEKWGTPNPIWFYIDVISVAFTGNSQVFKFIFDAGETGEFQRQAKFLRGEGA